MTIEKAIAKIWHCIVSIRDCVGNKEFVEALELSIEIMRKYQKIEQIMNQEQTQWGVIKDTWLYKEIREALEDGKID